MIDISRHYIEIIGIASFSASRVGNSDSIPGSYLRNGYVTAPLAQVKRAANGRRNATGQILNRDCTVEIGHSIVVKILRCNRYRKGHPGGFGANGCQREMIQHGRFDIEWV